MEYYSCGLYTIHVYSVYGLLVGLQPSSLCIWRPSIDTECADTVYK